MKLRASCWAFFWTLWWLRIATTSSRISASSLPVEVAAAEEEEDVNNDASTVTCPSRCSSNEKLPGARIAYLIMIHNERTLNDAVHLFRAIRDPRNLVLIHVDKKAEHLLSNETSLLHQEIRQCPCQSRVILKSVHDVQWGQWSMVRPTLWALQVAVTEHADQWDVFCNLSGDSMPVYTPDTMAEILQELPYNFVTSSSCETGLLPTDVYLFPEWWHKRAHYTKEGTEEPPVFSYTLQNGTRLEKTLKVHFGSQWMILQAPFCRWLVEELERADSLPSLFRDYLIQSQFLMSDETFVPTLLMHVDKFQETLPRLDDDGWLLWRNGTVSDIAAVRYERMDEHYPTAFGEFPTNQHLDVPDSSTTVEQTRPWGPYFLGVYDLGDIRDSGALFCRKVSDQMDANMVHLLPVDRAEQIPPIYWPEEIAVIPKPSLERLKEELMAKVKEVENLGELFGSGTDEEGEEL